MKNLRWVIIFFMTMNVHAAQQTTNAKDNTFYCLASNPLATVNVIVHAVNAPGFCKGPFVVSPGAVMGMPASVFNNSYFQLNEIGDKTGNIQVTVSDGEVECFLGQGEGRTPWGQNDSNCIVNS